jgi:hypothetical protein
MAMLLLVYDTGDAPDVLVWANGTPVRQPEQLFSAAALDVTLGMVKTTPTSSLRCDM